MVLSPCTYPHSQSISYRWALMRGEPSSTVRTVASLVRYTVPLSSTCLRLLFSVRPPFLRSYPTIFSSSTCALL